MYSLEGKVALVTGTANKHGIGRAIALRLASEGADVAVNDKAIPAGSKTPWPEEPGWKGIDSVAAEIAAMGRRALAVTADITKRADVERMVAEVTKKLGGVDILVNNAKAFEPIDDEGGTSQTSVMAMTDEMWNDTMGVNLYGAFLTCQAVAKRMVEQGRGGKIVNIASLKGKRGKRGRAAVCASKAGLIRLTETLALELGPYQINVNAICPGATVTYGSSGKALKAAIAGGLTEDQAIDKIYVKSGRFPEIGALGRPGRPDDQANAVAFLVSDQASFITGQAINVCGGQLMGI